VSTREIRTSIAQSACDVCGRTLLRGERAEIYVNGGARRSVCELCKSRALHGGWVLEGTVPESDESSARVERRRSLFSRLRTRRDEALAAEAPAAEAPAAADELSAERPPAPAWPDAPRQNGRAAAPRRRASSADGRRRVAPGRPRVGFREPRHVHAVPSSLEHRISSAVELYNQSEHPRTMAGIARSLGVPEVSVHAWDPAASIINVIVGWELCWYRYEVDLSEEVPSVRSVGQGYELHELSPLEREINASADDRGRLTLV